MFCRCHALDVHARRKYVTFCLITLSVEEVQGGSKERNLYTEPVKSCHNLKTGIFAEINVLFSKNYQLRKINKNLSRIGQQTNKRSSYIRSGRNWRECDFIISLCASLPKSCLFKFYFHFFLALNHMNYRSLV